MLDSVLVLDGHLRSMAQLGTDGQGRRGDLGPPTVERGHSGAARTTGRPLPGLGRGRVLGSLGPEDHSGLEFGLNCILDGIDALIAEQDGH